MNLYQRIWDERGYGKRRAKIMACKASESRKLCALVRLWNRMAAA
jgi:hypothetical protein